MEGLRVVEGLPPTAEGPISVSVRASGLGIGDGVSATSSGMEPSVAAEEGEEGYAVGGVEAAGVGNDAALAWSETISLELPAGSQVSAPRAHRL